MCAVVCKPATKMKLNVFLWLPHVSLAPTLLTRLYIDTHLHADTPKPSTGLRKHWIQHYHSTSCPPPPFSILFTFILSLLIIFTLALLCIQPLPLSRSSFSSHSSSYLEPLSTHSFKYTPPHPFSQRTTFSSSLYFLFLSVFTNIFWLVLIHILFSSPYCLAIVCGSANNRTRDVHTMCG